MGAYAAGRRTLFGKQGTFVTDCPRNLDRFFLVSSLSFLSRAGLETRVFVNGPFTFTRAARFHFPCTLTAKLLGLAGGSPGRWLTPWPPTTSTSSSSKEWDAPYTPICTPSSIATSSRSSSRSRCPRYRRRNRRLIRQVAVIKNRWLARRFGEEETKFPVVFQFEQKARV